MVRIAGERELMGKKKVDLDSLSNIIIEEVGGSKFTTVEYVAETEKELGKMILDDLSKGSKKGQRKIWKMLEEEQGKLQEKP